MVDTVCLVCSTIRVKGVLVSCIPRLIYSAKYCIDCSDQHGDTIREISYLEEELSWKVFSPKTAFTTKFVCCAIY